MKKSILVLMVLMLVPAASASVFSDILNWFSPHSQPTEVSNPQSAVGDNFDTYMAQMYQLNTPSNIQTLDTEMQKYGVQAIKVYVKDYSKDFYVVQGQGVLKDYPTYNKDIALSKAQIEQIKGYVSDGKITPYDEFKMWMIYKDL